MKNAFANPRGADTLHRCEIEGWRNAGNCERVCSASQFGGGWAGVKPSAHVAKARVSPCREAPVYLACIHMQIPIDMTTFTYCIFALGHILARQFPIVGFRPPVHLIDIIGRAADTRLHFYLHTFANQFEPNRSSVLALLLSLPSSANVPAFFVPLLCRRLANDFRSGVEPFARLYACHIFPCGNVRRVQVRRR